MITGRAAADQQPVLPIAEAMRLALESDSGTVPASITGVIAGVSREVGFLIVQDDSASMWVVEYPDDTSRSGPDRVPDDLHAGQRVMLRGVVDRGAYAPRFLPEEVEVLGESAVPIAETADLDRLFLGLDNARKVTLEGIVQACEQERWGRWHIGLAVKSRRIAILAPRETVSQATDLLDAHVRVTGFVGSVRNSRGEFLAPRLVMESPTDLDVLNPAKGSPFAAPFLAVNTLGRFGAEPVPTHRITTSGVVTLVQPGRMLFLQDGLDGIRVVTTGSAPLVPGDRVRVAGFLEQTRKIAGITGGIVEKIGAGPPPKPCDIEPSDVLRINSEARSRWMVAQPGNYDGSLIRFPARIVEVKTLARNASQVVLSSDSATLQAILDGADHQQLAMLAPGTEVVATGVLRIDWVDEPSDPQLATASDPTIDRLTLLLRSAADMVVLRKPSWWTPTRLGILLGGVAAVLAAALAWVGLLRRQVRATALRLTAEMRSRRDAAVEFNATLRERNRLAANLHDTLLQTLRGIDFQLGACQAQGDGHDGTSGDHLDVARKMVNHAAEELRGSVWALRTMPVAGKSFAESLEAIARQTGHGHAEHIAVRTTGPSFEVPQFVAGNLLLVAQEAIHNALAHADAGQIDVEAAFDAAGGTVELTVVDDGRGFTAENAAGPDQGHFGLSGMRERIDRLGGTFALDSSPGAGTTVRAKIRKHDYDSRLDVTNAEESSPSPPSPRAS
jgi:signal transduction histidine kinase